MSANTIQLTWMSTLQFAALYWITVVLSNVGKFGISAAFAVIYVWSAELFPTPVRNSGMGSSSMMARVGSMICPYIADLVSASLYRVFARILSAHLDISILCAPTLRAYWFTLVRMFEAQSLCHAKLQRLK